MAGEANVWQPKELAQVNADTSLVQESQIAAANQVFFVLSSFAYTVGVGSLLVYKNGAALRPGIDFVEQTTTTFGLVSPAAAGDTILAVGFVGVTATVDVRDTDIYVTNHQAIRDYAGTEVVVYCLGTTTANDGGEGFFNKVTGAAPATYVDDGSTIIVPTGGDGSAAWLLMDTSARLQANLADTTDVAKGDAQVGVKKTATGALATTQHEVNERSVSVFDFFTAAQIADVKSGAESVSIDTAVANAWTHCLANGVDLEFPIGLYSLTVSYPFQQAGTPTSLQDGKNITIYGHGPATILKTKSAAGADVLQLNGMKNLHFRNFQVTGELTGSAGAGTNGISVTNGFDNLTFFDIYLKDLPSLDKTSFVDGGKGLTIQPSTTVNECGTLKARIIADGCSYGFGYDLDLVTAEGKKTAVEVDLVAENCYIGAVISAGAATGAVGADMNMGVIVRGQFINNQRDVVLGRTHGCTIEADIITTKSIAARRLDHDGVAWIASVTTVDALACQYAKNSKISIKGNKGDCDYKVQIGGATAGSSGLNGATEFCDIYVDVEGTSVTSDFNAADSGGNTCRSCDIKVSASTVAAIPSTLFTSSKLNTLRLLGSYGNSLLPGNIQFPATQVVSSDVNVLDDYEEGTWTPILADTNLADEGATYTLRRGSYTKIGNRVYFDCYMDLSGLGTLTGGAAASIIGLPYASRNTPGNLSIVNIGYATGLALSAAATIQGRVGTNVSHITLSKWPAASTTGSSALTVTEISATGLLSMTGSYETDT